MAITDNWDTLDEIRSLPKATAIIDNQIVTVHVVPGSFTLDGRPLPPGAKQVALVLGEQSDPVRAQIESVLALLDPVNESDATLERRVALRLVLEESLYYGN